MNRYFVDKKNILKDSIVIARGEDVHHLARVLRVLPGEELYVSDGEGAAYIAVVERISGNEVILKIKQALKRVLRQDLPVVISLACAMPKNVRFDEIIDKCTQLGIDEIIPIITHRSLVREDIYDRKKERYERVMISAAKQSGVLFLPRLESPLEFSGLLGKLADYDLCLLPNLLNKQLSIRSVAEDFKGRRILAIIGPEGDFTPEEIRAATEAGCKAVSLGDSVLRVDTAAISSVGFLRLFFG